MPCRQPLRRSTTADRRRFLQGSLIVAAALPTLGRAGFAQAGEVNVYNWDTYIGETTLADFTEATGIEVRYDLFAGNDELFAKLREGNPGYDVIFPSNDYVERMIVGRHADAAGPRQDPQLRQHRAAPSPIPPSTPACSTHALFLGHGRDRLSQVEGHARPSLGGRVRGRRVCRAASRS